MSLISCIICPLYYRYLLDFIRGLKSSYLIITNPIQQLSQNLLADRSFNLKLGLKSMIEKSIRESNRNEINSLKAKNKQFSHSDTNKYNILKYL